MTASHGSEPSRLDSLLAGVFYLGLAITGGAAFIAVRPELFVDGDPGRTAANLAGRETLALLGVALELGTVTFQALAAVWFARMFRAAGVAAANAANALALFGMVNAVVILASAVLWRVAIAAASGLSGVVDPTVSYLLLLISARFWDFGSIFFGLWLLPMGWLVLQTRYGPRALGWVLILGGVGYMLSVFVGVLMPNSGEWADTLPLPATVGEFWMIGLLLWKGLRPKRGDAAA